MINEYVVLDLEMTGLSAKTDQIIEIGAVKIKDNQIDTLPKGVWLLCSTRRVLQRVDFKKQVYVKKPPILWCL